jgi:hypothetical protein
MGVRNGTVGRVTRLAARLMEVALADGRALRVDLEAYRHVEHGYAATIHKAQGATVDRAYVLAGPAMDRHSTYVALSRHRDAVELHYGRDMFASAARLERQLSRERAKDTSLDYMEAFAERRGLSPVDRSSEADAKEHSRRASGRFDGLALRTAAREAGPEAPPPSRRAVALRQAEARLAAALCDVQRRGERGLPALPHQRRAVEAARVRLEALRPDGARELEAMLVGRAPERGTTQGAERGRDTGLER